MTASDIATKVAQRAGLQIGKVDADDAPSSTTYSQAGQTDWEVLSALARDNNLEVAVRDGKFSFAAAGGRPARPRRPAAAPNTDPLVLQLGKDLLRFRSVADVGGPGRQGRGPRLGRGDQDRPHGDRGRDDHADRAADA